MNWKSEDPRDWKLHLRQTWKLSYELVELDSTILREQKNIKQNKRAYEILGQLTKPTHLHRSYQERDWRIEDWQTPE